MQFAARFISMLVLLVLGPSLLSGAEFAWGAGNNGAGGNLILSVPRTMTYQGILKNSGGEPVPESSFDVTFRIFALESGGAELWSQMLSDSTDATGYFTAELTNLDLPFDQDYWLELQIGSEVLSPRQKLGMVAYAARADTADYAISTINSGWADDGSIIRLENAGDSVGIGTDTPSEKLHVSGNLLVTGNALVGTGNQAWGNLEFIAGQDNQVSEDWSTIAGGSDNFIEAPLSFIGGGQFNEVTGFNGAAAGGMYNSVTGEYSFIGGGHHNATNGDSSAIAGGAHNIASGIGSFVGGGSGNIASNRGTTVSGGINNSATVFGSMVGGGFNNISRSDYSVISGGTNNQVTEPIGTIGGGANNYLEGESGVICGGWSNVNLGSGSVIAGGRFNFLQSENSAIVGGISDTITYSANNSYLFGFGSKLTQDSTFMIDLPHIRMGNEYNGYELPAVDGDSGMVMITDGSGNIDWGNIETGPLAWVDEGNWVRLENTSDNVNIGGNFNPGSKLYVAGDMVAQNITSNANLNVGSSITIDGSAATVTSSTGTLGFGNDNISTTGKASIGAGCMNSGLSAFAAGENNTASGSYSTVTGGINSTASGSYSSVGGGCYNLSYGLFNTIAGGDSNWIVGQGSNCTLSGGRHNILNGDNSTIAGGNLNILIANGSSISGGEQNYISAGGFCSIIGGQNDTIFGSLYSTILGGINNSVRGHYSMAYGNGVKIHTYSNLVVLYNSTHPGVLRINRDCDDGDGIVYAYPIQAGTNAGNGNGAYLSTGGTWTNGSSRTFKENFTPFEGNDLLSKISSLSITSWNFKNSTEKHVGPVAEEFVGAFDTGVIREDDGKRDDKYLAASDVAGVALAGVQELLKRIEALEKENAEMKAELTNLQNSGR